MSITLDPPTDTEKYAYLRGPQHRWFFLAHLVSFVGIGWSLYGFARMEYWTLIFLVPLTLYFFETVVGVWTSTFKRRVDRADHEFVVRNYYPEVWPTIDVYLPTCGESIDLLYNTYRNVANLVYPGVVKVWVLDDANRPDVALAARRYGFGYFARPGSGFKKAGNLQHAYERTDGEHILILDADFVPRPDALTEIVPYMGDDPRIGIVQTPQTYKTDKSLGWLERCAASTQELFYRFVQPSRDAVEATICCGTSALYRRAALDCSGGFPQIAHSEDVFTGFNMVEHGYRTAFVPIIVSKGFCPDAIDSFISQQYRWCEGSMELLRMSEFHFHPALNFRQRSSFWSGFLYYITTAMNAFFAPIPLLVMVWLFPGRVHPANFLPLIGLITLWVVVYPLLMRTNWRLDVLRVQTIYAFTHAVAIFDMFFGQQAEWVVTNSAGTAPMLLAIRVKRIMAYWLGGTVLATLGGIAYRLWQADYTLADWWAALLFFAVNLYIVVPVIALSLRTLHNDRRGIAAQTPSPIAARPLAALESDQ